MNLLPQDEHSSVECSSLRFLPLTVLPSAWRKQTRGHGYGDETLFAFFLFFLAALGWGPRRAGFERALHLRRIVRPAAPKDPIGRRPMPTSRPLPLLRPDRLRSIPRSFAWLDHRLRSSGLLARLAPEELGLYCFLTLAADAQGRSCWRLERVQRELPFDLPTLRRARDGLLQLDLLAYLPWHAHATDGAYQLLSLPSLPSPAARGECSSIGDLLARLDLKR